MASKNFLKRVRFVLLGLLLAGLLWALFGCGGAVFDLRPTAVAKAAPDSGEVPLAVRFDGSASTAVLDRTIVAYNWDFGDGSIGTEAITTHTYNTRGIITAVLTVTDSAGLTGTDKVFIDARGPSIVFSSGRDLDMIDYLPPPPGWGWLFYLCPILRFLDMWKMNSDGSGLTRVTRSIEAADIYPDLDAKTRNKITFSRVSIISPDCSAYEIDVYTANADGSNQVNLTPGTTSYDGTSTFSPDGKKIAFASDRDCPNPKDMAFPCLDLFVMNADGTDPVNLTGPQPNFVNAYPDWSPKGDKIAFISNRTGDGEVWVMNADGTGLQQLTNDPADDGGCTNSPICSPPSWSPDGTKIAWSTNRSGTYEIWVMNADGSNQVQVTNTPGYDSHMPYWLPNGQEIAYTHWIDMTYGSWPGPSPGTVQLPQLFKIDLGTGVSTQLTSITWNLAPGSKEE